jgi:hypothetical protein
VFSACVRVCAYAYINAGMYKYVCKYARVSGCTCAFLRVCVCAYVRVGLEACVSA